MKKVTIGAMALTAGLLLTGCDVSSLAGGDDETAPSTTLYLKDMGGTGVAGIAYSCDGGYDNDGPLITSGTTSSTGAMSTSYWPGYGFTCTLTLSNTVALFLHDANGPLNDVQVNCTSSSYQFTGEDGVDGSINNASSGTCTLKFDW